MRPGLTGFSLRQDSCAFLGAEALFSFARGQGFLRDRAINDDARMSPSRTAPGPPQRFGSDMPNTRSGGHTGEPSVCDQSHMFSERQVF